MVLAQAVSLCACTVVAETAVRTFGCSPSSPPLSRAYPVSCMILEIMEQAIVMASDCRWAFESTLTY